jgi:thiol-disulfide isomerase/thioredoxin
MNIANILYVLMMLFFFAIGISYGQSFVNSDVFKNTIAKDIVAVEFWASWNSSNEFTELSKLKECSMYRVDVGKCNKIQNNYDVIGIPTVIIFENGEEKERFEPNIMFKLSADKKTIQHSIDTLTLNKFQ